MVFTGEFPGDSPEIMSSGRCRQAYEGGGATLPPFVFSVGYKWLSYIA